VFLAATVLALLLAAPAQAGPDDQLPAQADALTVELLADLPVPVSPTWVVRFLAQLDALLAQGHDADRLRAAWRWGGENIKGWEILDPSALLKMGLVATEDHAPLPAALPIEALVDRMYQGSAPPDEERRQRMLSTIAARLGAGQTQEELLQAWTWARQHLPDWRIRTPDAVLDAGQQGLEREP